MLRPYLPIRVRDASNAKRTPHTKRHIGSLRIVKCQMKCAITTHTNLNNSLLHRTETYLKQHDNALQLNLRHKKAQKGVGYSSLYTYQMRQENSNSVTPGDRRIRVQRVVNNRSHGGPVNFRDGNDGVVLFN